jgi:hypothetical protein
VQQPPANSRFYVKKRELCRMNLLDISFRDFTHSLVFWSFLLLLVGCDSPFLEETKEDEAPQVKVSLNGQSIPNEIFLYDFRPLKVGQTQTLTFTVTNQGKKTLVLGEVLPDNENFYVTPFEVSQLAQGESTDFSVTFAPKYWGDHIANVGFLCNDPKNTAFNFLVRGAGDENARISYRKVQTPDGLNTITFNDGEGEGTRFLTTLDVYDPGNTVNNAARLHLRVTFEDGTEGTLLKTVDNTNPNALQVLGNQLTFGLGIRFGESAYVDVQAQLELNNGVRTNTVNYRIPRPEGAN